MSPGLIACRTASYAPFEALAYEHLAGVGVRQVEIPVPTSDSIDATRAELDRHGLNASSLHGECDVGRVDVAAQVAGAILTGCDHSVTTEPESAQETVADLRRRGVGGGT